MFDLEAVKKGGDDPKDSDQDFQDGLDLTEKMSKLEQNAI